MEVNYNFDSAYVGSMRLIANLMDAINAVEYSSKSA